MGGPELLSFWGLAQCLSVANQKLESNRLDIQKVLQPIETIFTPIARLLGAAKGNIVVISCAIDGYIASAQL